MRHYKQGYFKPNNPQKYRGDPTNITYRSGWEKLVMISLDNNPAILEWSSEEIVIPYISPLDGKPHRYFPDFYAKAKTKDGGIQHQILEIKPKKETLEPKKKKKITEAYVYEVTTWGKNQAKWAAAEEYCRKKGWTFRILTEEHLGLKAK